MPVTKNPSVYAVSAYIRLGHKYQMGSLVRQALSYLNKYLPTALDAWQFSSSYWPKGFRHEHAISVVNFARLLDYPFFLPSCLLLCCNIYLAGSGARTGPW